MLFSPLPSHMATVSCAIMLAMVSGALCMKSPMFPTTARRRGVKLHAGMVIAIEPMITMGSPRVKVGRDGWLVSTKDHLPAAHFENTVAITNDGPVIITSDESGAWCDMQGGSLVV